ncbi:hypothetical protein MmiAt1_10830 [Methanimicrococcus sp. At1]|uniref:ATP-dependent DNA helicase RecG C-terminal domain-containing protein n=1 Tax=Methanimicrococcus hacksteinii TaxID=3028293 RepID=A0ABU3VQ08_9EURY|nr:hypothetical protein [Methanimicrococcus sp. At1]
MVKGITLDDVKLGISVTRNRNLANIFYRLTFIESYGTGIPKIMHNYNGYENKPQIEATNNAFKITLPNTADENDTATGVSAKPQNKNAAQDKTAVQNKPAETESRTGDEQIVMILFDENEFITRQDIETALGASQAKALRVLKRLAEKGKIQTIGGGRSTKYTKKAKD